MSTLTTLEGIGPAYEAKLKTAGISSCELLLEMGATPKGRAQIVETSGLGKSQIQKFVNHADLCRIKGVGGEYSELLEASGVDTVPELAQRNPEHLASKMTELNAEKKLVRSPPSVAEVKRWILQAKELPRVIFH